MFGINRLFDFAVAEARARRRRVESDRIDHDHRAERPDDFDATRTPSPSWSPRNGATRKRRTTRD